MGLRLPPLNTLRLFEAAGRELSFKAAAQELGVTSSAVSHAVQILEDWLGTPLFFRRRRGLTLTPAGENYLPAVAEALGLLAGAARLIPGRDARDRLHISVAPTFASRLLLPRLGRLRDRLSGIEVTIDTSHRLVEFPRDDADVAIRLGHGEWPGLCATHLLTESLFPVCSPTFLQQIGEDRAFDRVPLIYVTLVSQDWQVWAEACGYRDIPGQKGLKVDTVQMAIEAAVQGLGIAIGRRPFIERELARGDLVPFDEREVLSGTSYWLVAPPETMKRPEISTLQDWLSEELRPIVSKVESSNAALSKGSSSAEVV